MPEESFHGSITLVLHTLPTQDTQQLFSDDCEFHMMADEDEDMYEPTADDALPSGPAKPREESSEEDESEDDSDSVSSAT